MENSRRQHHEPGVTARLEGVGFASVGFSKIANTASNNIQIARAINTIPTHGTTPAGAVNRPLTKNAGRVIWHSAHVLIVYIKSVGKPTTPQTQAARRVRHNQTVTPNNVNAASN